MLRRALTRSPLLVAFIGLWACDDNTVTSSAGTSTNASGGATSSTSSTGAGGAGGAFVCTEDIPPDLDAPELLSETGLFNDIAQRTLAPCVQLFEPRYHLWSDGAVKDRYVYLPPGTQIDTSDMNDWSFPVGTRFWKSFTRDGVLVETRLIERSGSGPDDFIMTTYVWNDDESDALRVTMGLENAKGTDHDVPSDSDCEGCHGGGAKYGGRPSRALGFSAIQLTHDGTGVTFATLATDGMLSVMPDASGHLIPGDELATAAIGYLHANCGHCHNDTPDGIQQVGMHLWTKVDADSVETTAVWLTAVDIPTEAFNQQGITARIEPGNPSASAVHYRLSQRGNNDQMPPIGTSLVDRNGLDAVGAWIASLPPTP